MTIKSILLETFLISISIFCHGITLDKLSFSTDFNPTNISLLNSNFKFDESKQELRISIGKDVITNEPINGLILSSDDDITLKTDTKIKIYTSEFDTGLENIIVNDIPISQLITKVMETQKLDFINAQNPLWGKKLVIVGDSESSGVYSYGNKLAERNNMMVENKSIGGYSLVGSGQLFEKYQEYIPSDTDYIIVHIGCNDGAYWNSSIDDDSTDTTTFKGAWNMFLSGLKQNYPNAKKAIMIHFYWNTDSGRDTRAQWMKTRCNIYELEYLDGVESFGFSPSANGQYFNWETINDVYQASPYHLSGLGHLRVSYIVETFLKTRVQISK